MVEEKVCVKVLSSMIAYASDQISQFDDEFKSKLQGLDEIIQWKIGDDIANYTQIKDSKITFVEGTASNPSLTFEIPNVSDALKMLTGQIDQSEFGNIMTIKGDAAKLQELSFIMETVGKYSEGMAGGG